MTAEEPSTPTSTAQAAKLVGRLLAKLTAVDHDLAEAQAIAAALDRSLADGTESAETRRWLDHVRAALDRVQLECADGQFSARQLRDQLPAEPVLQLRLLE